MAFSTNQVLSQVHSVLHYEHRRNDNSGGKTKASEKAQACAEASESGRCRKEGDASDGEGIQYVSMMFVTVDSLLA